MTDDVFVLRYWNREDIFRAAVNPLRCAVPAARKPGVAPLRCAVPAARKPGVAPALRSPCSS
jgi:hypothetical protein